MMASEDLVSALETPFKDPAIESKFNALKKLQVLKIKSLMTSLDAMKKENDKLKALGKDSRRTQMIQNLRTKLKNQELITDFLKQELVIESKNVDDESKGEVEDTRRKFYSLEQVSEYVIKKTTGGPKRFRPLIREELENKILALERENEKCRKMQQKLENKVSSSEKEIKDYKRMVEARGSGGTVDASAKEEKGGPMAEPKSLSRGRSKGNNGDKTDSNSESKDLNDKVENMRILTLKDQIQTLEMNLDMKNTELDEYREEVTKMRNKLSRSKVDEETLKCKEKLYNEMEELYQKTSDELDDTSTALALAREETNQANARAEAQIQAQKDTIDRLHNSLETAMKQNKSMLSEIHRTERLSSTTEVPSLTVPIPVPAKPPAVMQTITETELSSSASVTSSSPIQEERKTGITVKEKQVYEQKITNLRQKLMDSESKLRDLLEEGGPKKVASLMDDLRLKNDTIRDLKRDINEISRRVTASGNDRKSGDQGSSSAISEELVSNLYDEVRRLKNEVDRLKSLKSSTSSPKRTSSTTGYESNGELLGRISQLEQEKGDLIEDMKDLKSALNQTGGFSDAANFANALVDGFKNVLIDIHDKVALDTNSHALSAMSDCKAEGEVMVKVDDPAINRDKLIELLEVFEFFFEEHGASERNDNIDENDGLGSPFNA